MTEIYIVGAGGAAKEIYYIIKSINNVTPTYDFKGFIDVSEHKTLKIGDKDFEIIDENLFFKKNDKKINIVFAIGDPIKLKIIASLYTSRDNLVFPNIIHPNVVIDQSIKMGNANVISEACIFTVDSSIGSYNYLNRGVHIGHDCNIASYNVINPCAVISGSVKIEDGVFVGTNATVLQNLSLGKNAIIGAGAVVVKNVNKNTKVVGVPAKEIN